MMRRSPDIMRRRVLQRLFNHLAENYSITLTEREFTHLPLHTVDSLLAFKTDVLLDELRSALDRLDEGSYGQCLICRGAISQHLLDINPAVRYCRTCDRTYTQLSPVGDFHLEHQH